MKKNKPIILTNYGLGSSYNEFIEINKKLQTPLKDKILEHELRHDSGKYSVKDWKNDFQSKKPHFFEALWFSLKNPEALINYFFVMYSYYGKFWTINLTSLFPFFYFGLIWTLFFKLMLKINILLAFLGWACFYIITNILLLIYTHIYVFRHKN